MFIHKSRYTLHAFIACFGIKKYLLKVFLRILCGDNEDKEEVLPEPLQTGSYGNGPITLIENPITAKLANTG